MNRKLYKNSDRLAPTQVTNWRLLCITILVVVIVSPLVYFWHRHCVSRMGVHFSDRAEMATKLAEQKAEIESLLKTQPADGDPNSIVNQRLQEFDLQLAQYDKSLSLEKDRPSSAELWGRAAKSLDMYNRMDKFNAKDRKRLAIAYSNSVNGNRNPRRAAQLFSQAAALLPDQRDELLVQASDFYARGFDFSNAQEKIEGIGSVESLAPEKRALLAKVKAKTFWGHVFLVKSLKSSPQLGNYLAEAIELNPQNLELPTYLALLYRQPELRSNLSPAQISQMEKGNNSSYQNKAEQIIDSMVKRNQNSANALLQRYKYRASVNPFTSLTDLEKAEKLEPFNTDIQFELGKSRFNNYTRNASRNPATVTSDPETWPPELVEAKANFHLCRTKTPNRIPVYLYLGELERLFQNIDGAVEIWLEGLDQKQRVNSDGNALIQIRQNVIMTLIDRFDQNDPDSEKWLAQAEEQLSLLDQFINKSGNQAGSPEALFELSQSRKFLGAALLTRRGEYGSAIDLLTPAIRNEADAPVNRTFVMLRLLGTIYAQLGLDSQAAATFESAVKLTENQSIQQEFSQLAIDARRRTGQTSVAATDLSPPSADNESTADWYRYASFLLQLETNKPPQLRSLTSFNNAMQRLEKLNATAKVGDSWRVSLLGLSGRALSLDKSNTDSTALVDLLKELEPASVDNAELSIKLAELYAKLDARDQALDLADDVDRMLTQFESLSGGSAESYVLSANISMAQNKPAEARAKIEEGIKNHQTKDQKGLKLAMISLLLTDGNVSGAFENLRQLASDFPNSPELTMRLAAICIQFPILNTDEPADWETRLKQIEGADGVYTKCLQVIRVLRNVNRQNDISDLTTNRDELNQAKELCRSIVAQRPNWSVGHTMTGQVLLAQSVNLKETNRTNRNLDDSNFNQLRSSALGALSRAVELGESRRWVLVPLAQMQTPEDRNKTLELLKPETIVRDPDLLRMQVSMSIAGNDTETALNTVKFATETNPNNALNWLTLAAIQLNLGKSDDALASCEKARSVSKATAGEERQRAMRNLFNFYGTASQFGPQPTNTTWEKKALEVKPAVLALYEGPEQTFQKAQMLAIMGNPGAGAEFVKTVDAEPTNKKHLLAAIEYFTTGNATTVDAFSEGIRMCQLLKQLPDLDDRERLKYIWVEANLYAKRGTKEDWQSLKLLFADNNIDQSAQNAAEYNILLAVLLLTKSAVTNSERQQNLTEAFGLVENGRNAAELVLGGQVKQLLAPFQKDESKKAEFLADAKGRFVEAAATNELVPSQLVTIVRFFTEQKEWDAAEQYLGRLKSTLGEPLEDNVPAIALQAEILKQKGTNPVEIIQIVNSFGEDLLYQVGNTSKMNQARQCQRIADILANIDESEGALKWSEKAVTIEPRYRLALALENNKVGNKDKAVDLCLTGYSETNELTYLIALTQVLITGTANEDHFKKGNDAFDIAMKRRDLTRNEKVNLMLSIANVRIAGENRTQDAIKIYKEADQLIPGNLLILNNLATAYSETSDELDVAMDYVNQAISRHGNRPELIDTKAVILMKLGKLKESLALLTDITNFESDPRYWWHRAEVEFKMHQATSDSSFLEAARKHYKLAQSLKLANQVFTPNEEARLNDLEKNLSAQTSPATDADPPSPSENSSLNIKYNLSAQNGMQVTI